MDLDDKLITIEVKNNDDEMNTIINDFTITKYKLF